MRTDPQPDIHIFGRKPPFRNLSDRLDPELLGKPVTPTYNTLLIT